MRLKERADHTGFAGLSRRRPAGLQRSVNDDPK
jgi:hypothetical protein